MKSLAKRFLSPYPNSGSILVVSIWVLVFFSILSAELYKMVSTQARLAKSLRNRSIGQYLAKAASVYARVERKKDKTPHDTLFELRSKRQRQLGRGEFIYELIDEESKININTASAEVIARLPGLTPKFAEAIISSPLRPFHLKEELLLVDEMSEEIFDKCRDFITVYSEGGVNINTAPPEVLSALGLDEDLVEDIEDFRKGADNEEATEDDRVFENPGEIINKLRAQGMFEAQESKLLEIISQNLITVESKNFTLKIETKILNKPAVKYDIVIDKEKIKQWTER